jgi:hypothetical protein
MCKCLLPRFTHPLSLGTHQSSILVNKIVSLPDHEIVNPVHCSAQQYNCGHRCSNYMRRPQVCVRVCLDQCCLPASNCDLITDMGKTIRYMGTETNITYWRCTLFPDIHHLRHSPKYEGTHCRSCTARYRRRRTRSTGLHNYFRSL